MPQPIFVIGKNRCGTKWLSNCIANHPEVACVQGEDFTGILETNFFVQFPMAFGNLSQSENFCALAACFSQTSFFKITGLPESVLFEKHFTEYPAFFRHVMDAYARKQGCDYWLQKAGPLTLPLIYPAFPDARFIIINRERVDSVKSGLTLTKSRGWEKWGVLNEVAVAQLNDKTAALYEDLANVTGVSYEQLRNDRRKTIETLCEFLDLSWVDAFMEDHWRKNTSFSSAEDRKHSLSPRQVHWVRVCDRLLSLLPLSVLRLMRKWKGRRNNPDDNRFISSTFRFVRKEYGWPQD